ncbi:MAG: type II secretion system protein GspK [bacterium]|nr:type II secretion system protein GspK [bacterium]
MSQPAQNREGGFALLLVVFILSLASIVALETGRMAFFDRRNTRGFVESIQGEYVLKSGLNLARVLLELPKLEGVNEDWLGDPWAMIGQAPSLPIEGLTGEPRISIVDNSGLININALGNDTSQAGIFTGFNNPQTQGGGISDRRSAFWKHAAANLFEEIGLVREELGTDSLSTIGGVAFGPPLLPSVIDDWIDGDNQSFSSENYDVEGVESFAPKEFFFNRKLYAIEELMNIPGFTSSRVLMLSKFLRADPGINNNQLININTAPAEVLAAMGLSGVEISQAIEERLNLPVTSNILQTLLAPYPELKPYFSVNSNSFSVYVRAKMPSRSRWLHAIVTTSGMPPSRNTYPTALTFQ